MASPLRHYFTSSKCPPHIRTTSLRHVTSHYGITASTCPLHAITSSLRHVASPLTSHRHATLWPRASSTLVTLWWTAQACRAGCRASNENPDGIGQKRTTGCLLGSRQACCFGPASTKSIGKRLPACSLVGGRDRTNLHRRGWWWKLHSVRRSYESGQRQNSALVKEEGRMQWLLPRRFNGSWTKP
jgi:hypothetical protein